MTVNGAWEITNVEFKSPDTTIVRKPFKSIYLFTDKHYSIEIAWEDRKSWSVLEEDEERNPEDIINAYSHLTSNSGSYEIKGDSIVFDVMVAKSPNYMNNSSNTVRSHKLEGNKLLIQATSGNGETSQVITLVRIK